MLWLMAFLACGDKSMDTSVVEPGSEPATEDTQTEDTQTDDTQTEVSGADALSVGDIVITEIMKNPCVLGGDLDGDGIEDCTVDDAVGEWFEVLNTTSAEINLKGLMIHELDDGNPDTDEETLSITADVPVAAGAYVVFGVSNDTSINGMVAVDVAYAHDAFTLGNGTDDIALSNAFGLLDSVSYNDNDFPDIKGSSLSLSPSAVDVSSNDTGANWCEATTVMSSGDRGTPGAGNETCP